MGSKFRRLGQSFANHTGDVSITERRYWHPLPMVTAWTVGLAIGHVILGFAGYALLVPEAGPASFWPVAGIPVAFGILFGRRATPAIILLVLGTELAVRAAGLAPLQPLEIVLAVGAQLLATVIAVVLTDQVQLRFWHQPEIRTAAFLIVAAFASAVAAPLACATGSPYSFGLDCLTWAIGQASGIVLVGSLAIAAQQLRPWHAASRPTRLAGTGSLVGAVATTFVGVYSGSPGFILMSMALVTFAVASADIRPTLAATSLLAGVLAWSQANPGQLTLANSSAELAVASLLFISVITMIAGITLQSRFVANELAGVLDALPNLGIIVDKRHHVRRLIVPREFRHLPTQTGEHISVHVHAEDLPRAELAIDEALEGRPSSVQMRVKLSIGERVFDANVARISRWRALIVAVDVTETIELVRQRDWDATRYRSIANSLGDGLAEIDLETELVIYANQSWADALEVSLDEVIGQRLSHPLKQRMDTSEIRRRLRRKDLEPFEFSFLTGNGERKWILVNAIRSFHPDGGGSMVVVGNDITRVRDAERRRLKIENELTMVEETERQRIATALHNSPIQMLTAVGLRLGALQNSMDPTGDANGSELAELERVVGESISELRSVISSLTVPDASAGKIFESLQHYLDRIGIDRQRVVFIDDLASPPTGQIGVALFGIAREAVVNALLHSGADQVTVKLSSGSRGVDLEVADDGIGFDPDQRLGEDGHLGLRSLFEYAASVGGRCDVVSSPGNGTSVVAAIPLPQRPSERAGSYSDGSVQVDGSRPVVSAEPVPSQR